MRLQSLEQLKPRVLRKISVRSELELEVVIARSRVLVLLAWIVLLVRGNLAKIGVGRVLVLSLL